MDNICHSLAGAAIAEAGFTKKFPRATLLCVLGANIPDVDAFTYIWADSLTALQFRRGWTHGVPALITWTLVLTGLFWWWNRRSSSTPSSPGEAQAILAAASVSVFSHTSLDWLNNYGVRWLMPFSQQWFYGDTLFIVDFVLLALFGGGWWIARRRRARGVVRAERSAQFAIALAMLYIVGMKSLSEVSRSAAIRSLGLTATGRRDVMVAPKAASVLVRDVLVRRDSTYNWYSARVHFGSIEVGERTVETPIGAADPRARRAAETPEGRGFLRWSRFPYYAAGVDGDSALVVIGDVRYAAGTQDSWAATRVRLR
jgi:inner membrane protein